MKATTQPVAPHHVAVLALAAFLLGLCAAPARSQAPAPTPGQATVQPAPAPAAAPAPAMTAAPETPPSASPADVASMDAILGALYDVISGPAGQARDWNRFRSLFVPGARLIPVRVKGDGGAEATVVDVEGYIKRAAPFFEREGFFEREAARKTEQFGNIAHVFSTYESRHALADPAPFARGINSIQLMKDAGRWWVVTVYWDSERPGNPIPAEYLPK